MGGNPIQLDYTVLFTLFFPMLFSLIFVGFIIYIMISTLRFFKRKIEIDQEILQKLDELITLQTKPSDKK